LKRETSLLALPKHLFSVSAKAMDSRIINAIRRQAFECQRSLRSSACQRPPQMLDGFLATMTGHGHVP
jgi:hypothetical protein